ncbi:MAG: GAF domain-containing protein, partial [Acidobacteria bacterium]|nr:GAF domain-containing protein [Acidobacteriota bacterium]
MDETARAQGTAGNERRKGERITFDPPREAMWGDRRLRIIDVGREGIRALHDEPLQVGATGEIDFEWQGRFRLPVRVLRTSGSETAMTFAEPPQSLLRQIAEHEADHEITRLRKLVEASKLINSSIEPDSLYESILTVARNELDVDRGTLYFVDHERGEIWTKIAAGLQSTEIRLPVGKGLAGHVAETGQHLILHDAYADPRFDSSHDKRSGYTTRSMLCAPIKNRDGKVVGVLQLLNKQHGSFGEGDLAFLDSISDHMAIAMENATLHLDLLEKNRMEKELELGREIQSRLLPKPPSDLPGVQLAARSVACYEVGGDYYDFLELAGGDLGIALGDVSGKGVAAALIMSSIQTAIRVAAPLENDLSRLIARLNGLIYRSAQARKYATFFFGRYDAASGELRYVNA